MDEGMALDEGKDAFLAEFVALHEEQTHCPLNDYTLISESGMRVQVRQRADCECV